MPNGDESYSKKARTLIDQLNRGNISTDDYSASILDLMEEHGDYLQQHANEQIERNGCSGRITRNGHTYCLCDQNET